jgi:hypothetical protein
MRRLRDARQIARHSDLVDMLRLGTQAFETALKEATSRQQAATSEEAQLARLQSEAPDVAALVVESWEAAVKSGLWGQRQNPQAIDMAGKLGGSTEERSSLTPERRHKPLILSA